MSSMVMVESSREAATTVLCEDCTDETEVGKGFYDGKAAIQNHADDHPFHRVSFLRREIA